MPKSKPSQVIVHRIELQEKERDMLETLIAGKTANNLVLPVSVVMISGVAYLIADGIYDFASKHADRFKAGLQDNKEAFKFANDRNVFGPLSPILRLFGA